MPNQPAFKGIITAFNSIVGRIIALLISIFISNNLGVEILGAYNLGNRLVTILIPLILFGNAEELIRSIPKVNPYKAKDFLKRRTFKVLNNLILVVPITFIAITAIAYFNDNFIIQAYSPFIAGTLIITSLLFIITSYYIGNQKSELAPVFNEIIPLTFLICCLTLLNPWNEISAIEHVGTLKVLSLVLSLLILTYWLLKPINITNHAYNWKLKLQGNKELVTIDFLTILLNSIAILILFIFDTNEKIAIYTIPLQITMLSNVLLNGANLALKPLIAQSRDSKEKIFTIIIKSYWLYVIAGIIPFVFFIIFGKNILQIWDENLVSLGYPILIIISFGQLFNCLAGPGGITLTMIGKEMTLRKVTLITTIIAIPIYTFSYFKFELIGLAFTYTFILIFINTLKSIKAISLWRKI